MKVVITREISSKAKELFAQNNIDVEIWPNQLPPKPSELKELCKEADGIISMLSDQINKELIDSCSNLKAISNYAVGYNNIDTEYCKEKSIRVGNTPDVLTEATAELALALTLASTRNLVNAHNDTRKGSWKTWEPMGYLGPALKGKTLGIFGMGRIGFSYARKMKLAFDMNIIYTARNKKVEYEKEINAQKVSLEELSKTSDILSIHSPLTDETRGVFNENIFNNMKTTLHLINTARGEIIDQDALVKCLTDNSISGAALDVTTPEPLPLDHPLYKCKNLTLVPHIGSATNEARNEMAELAAKNIINALIGKEMPARIC
ncbi:MAG: D-glycerate dehydrogenase [Bacteriovoracaceae bacterium]|nr:D-glycerate dehydrogenase [Bacteriovoracaceae bacterium]